MSNGIVNTLTLEGFRREFKAYGREENFSPRGLESLFNYLEGLADDMGERIELDVVALCCDYYEYDSLEEIQADYSLEHSEGLDTLREHTTVIEIPNSTGIIIQQF